MISIATTIACVAVVCAAAYGGYHIGKRKSLYALQEREVLAAWVKLLSEDNMQLRGARVTSSAVR